jgi:hypothetical protein
MMWPSSRANVGSSVSIRLRSLWRWFVGGIGLGSEKLAMGFRPVNGPDMFATLA